MRRVSPFDWLLYPPERKPKKPWYIRFFAFFKRVKPTPYEDQ